MPHEEDLRTFPLPDGSGRAYRANRDERFVGRFLDNLIVMGPGLVIYLVAALALRDSQTTATVAASLGGLVFVGSWVANMVLLARTGQTLGKRLVQTELITTEGGRVGVVHAVLLREVIFAVLRFIPLLGNLVSLADGLAIFGNTKRCLHDHLAGTEVVSRKRIASHDAQETANVFA